MLKIYNTEAETELHTDASAQDYAVIFFQRDDEDRFLYPVYYENAKTNNRNRNIIVRDIYKLELLAIINALRKFRVYLIGITFKIVTNSDICIHYEGNGYMYARWARWALLLQDFWYTIEHRPKRSMRHVTHLFVRKLLRGSTKIFIECSKNIERSGNDSKKEICTTIDDTDNRILKHYNCKIIQESNGRRKTDSH